MVVVQNAEFFKLNTIAIHVELMEEQLNLLVSEWTTTTRSLKARSSSNDSARIVFIKTLKAACNSSFTRMAIFAFGAISSSQGRCDAVRCCALPCSRGRLDRSRPARCRLQGTAGGTWVERAISDTDRVWVWHTHAAKKSLALDTAFRQRNKNRLGEIRMSSPDRFNRRE